MANSHRCLRMTLLSGLLGCAALVHAQDRSVRQVADFGMPVSTQQLAAVRGGFDIGEGLEVSFGIQRAVYVDGNLVTYINVSVPDIAHITTQQALALATALGTIDVQVGPGNTFDPTSASQVSATAAPQSASGLAAGHAGTTAATQASPAVTTAAIQAMPAAVTLSTPASPPISSTVIPAATTQGAPASPLVNSTVIPASVGQASAATVIQNTVDNQVIRSLTTLNVAVNALNALRNQGLQQSLQSAQQLQAMSH
ncbi:hypothetical protein [Dyella choica]|uniref:Flagellin n=1 Tax=Dyella choica TaxID=1927959 RepID=A0A3S0PFF3_9GAMM|nr:hypothetical protein [Dyella choica]RUL69531.1 hypothetical protein EKH80_22200 [Dyella choica]